MNEKPLERLNYFNGQRLQATDLKLEQDYHMRVRRWLNRSLYSAGIADGLTVTKVPGAPKVRVSPGLALDVLGREIILLEEWEENVHGNHVNNEHYLTIRYNEEVLAQQNMGCSLGGGAQEKVAWGGPARVLAEPLLEWSDQLPREDSGKVLLARVTLSANCTEVDVLDTSVRNYVGNASASRVKQYALEGFRDIDENNEGVIRFHIRGRQPSSVTLFLRGEKFPGYFYSELGKHKHTFTPSQGTTLDAAPSASSMHSHSDGSLTTNTRRHRHTITAHREGGGVLGSDIAFVLSPNITGSQEDILALISGSMSNEGHSHSISGSTGSNSVTHHHSHKFTAPGQVENFGADIVAKSNDDSLTYINSLELSVKVGSRIISITRFVLTQLANLSPEWEGETLGDGNEGHVFVAVGTPGIRIDLLPEVSIGEGEYEIELSVGGHRNGGRIYYNLYVE